jgi:hyperosmotically inducible periplasmic protein
MDIIEEQVIDERIKRDIVEQLYWDDRVDASRVTVEVVDGEVTLGGVVHSSLSRAAAEMDSWAIPGVRAVNNQIRIEAPWIEAHPTDAEIQQMVLTVLKLNSSIDAATVHVQVHNASARLTGTVDAVWQKIKAEELVFEVRGVRWVVNEIAVVPSKKLSDKAIAERLVLALERNAQVDVEGVDVTVQDGVVTIAGTVMTPAAYWVAYRTALYTPGVRSVRNDLVIAGGKIGRKRQRHLPDRNS